MLRLGAMVTAIGVLLDAPPHLLPHASLDTLALAGHVVVLAGMVLVLFGLVAVAVAVPRPPVRTSVRPPIRRHP